MKKALRALLNALDTIVEEFEEVTDTDVRERMRAAIRKSVLAPRARYVLPDEFGMYSPKGDAKVKAALAKFITAAKEECKKAGLSTRQARLDAFQDIRVQSRGGSTYDEYFGYVDADEGRG